MFYKFVGANVEFSEANIEKFCTFIVLKTIKISKNHTSFYISELRDLRDLAPLDLATTLFGAARFLVGFIGAYWGC